MILYLVREYVMLNDEEMEEIILLTEYRSLRERYVTSFFLKSNRSTITTLLISREILYPTVRTRTPSMHRIPVPGVLFISVGTVLNTSI